MNVRRRRSLLTGSNVPGREYRSEVRVVINAVPAGGTSLGVVTENLVKNWDPADDLHVVLRAGVELDLPEGVTAHTFGGSRLATMDVRVPSLCRHLRAEAMLGMSPATTMAPLPCPRGVIVYDLRHERRPEQFAARIRLRRWASYPIGYRQADAIVCISHRTRDDLLALHPSLRRRRVTVAQLGADHVLAWPRRQPGPEYALAFGQFGNKNVDLVLDAWEILHGRGEALPLVVVGLPAAAAPRSRPPCRRRGMGDLVSVRPWLSDADFQPPLRVRLTRRLPLRLRRLRPPRRGGDAPRDPGRRHARPGPARGDRRATHGDGRLGRRGAGPCRPPGESAGDRSRSGPGSTPPASRGAAPQARCGPHWRPAWAEPAGPAGGRTTAAPSTCSSAGGAPAGRRRGGHGATA